MHPVPFECGRVSLAEAAFGQGTGAGKVDTGFNASGPGGVDNQVRGIIPLPNGQVVIGGDFTQPRNQWGLNLLNANGSADTNFNNGLRPTFNAHANRLYPRHDGGYYVQGVFTGVGTRIFGYTNLALIAADGTHDTNFIARNFGTAPTSSFGAAVLPDDRLLVNLATNLLAIVGADGVAGTPFPAADLTSISLLAVRTNGQIYAAGSRGAMPALVRLNADGSLDATFMEPVLTLTNTLPGPFRFTSLVVQPDDKLLVVGKFSHVNGVLRGGLARLNSDGSLDASFVPGTGGIGFIYQGQLVPADKATLLPDGRIILTRNGPFHYNNISRAGVGRISTSGALDTGFDPGTGPAGPDFVPAGQGILAAAVGPNGEIYVGGAFTNFNGTGRKFIVRLNMGTASAKPTIVSTPQSQSVSNGVNVTFSVMANGPGPLTYSWKHNNKVIPGATNASLTVSNVQLANVGAYIVSVLNSAGATVAAPAILTVNGVSVPDITKPAFTVTSPRGTFVRVFSNQFAFSGTSRDNLGLGAICYQQDTNPWTQVVLTSNWTFNVQLHPGTNLFRVKATDIAGNNSATQKVTVFYVVTQALNLKFGGTGVGMVTGATNTQGLEIGRNYRLTAVPKPGNLFSNWIADGLIVTNPVLSLFMWSNSTVCANFVTNPFIALGGTYQGIFEDPMQFTHASSGFLNFTLASRGSYSGQLRLGGAVLPLSGTFGLDLATTKLIPRRGTTDVLVAMQLNLGTDSLTGFVSNALFFSFIGGYHALPPASNYVGAYTLAIAAGDEPGDTPPAPGYATFTLARSGALTLIGRLSDDTPFSQSVRARANGDFVIYPALYGGKGSLVGGFSRDAVYPQANPYGILLWNKLPRPGGFYTNGFGGMRLAIGSSYMAPARGVAALAVTNLDLTLSGDGLTNDLVIPVFLGPNHRFTVNGTNTHRLTLTVTPTTGAVLGSFTHPVTGRVVPIKAVLLKNQDAGAGYFVTTNGTGTVLLGAPDLN
jgi:uncharacterized delta-60 repeat protein